MAFYLSCIRWWLLLLPAAFAVWLLPAALTAYVRFYCQIGFKGAECAQLSLKDQRRRAARLAQ